MSEGKVVCSAISWRPYPWTLWRLFSIVFNGLNSLSLIITPCLWLFICFQASRFPVCSMECAMPASLTNSWRNAEPMYAASTKHVKHKVLSWNLPEPLSKPKVEVDTRFLDKLRSALLPLNSLSYNEKDGSYSFNPNKIPRSRDNFFSQLGIFFTIAQSG